MYEKLSPCFTTHAIAFGKMTGLAYPGFLLRHMILVSLFMAMLHHMSSVLVRTSFFLFAVHRHWRFRCCLDVLFCHDKNLPHRAYFPNMYRGSGVVGIFGSQGMLALGCDFHPRYINHFQQSIVGITKDAQMSMLAEPVNHKLMLSRHLVFFLCFGDDHDKILSRFGVN